MKRMSFLLALVIGAGLFLLANPKPAFAQGETGSVTGVVTDPQGGTVAGADVTLMDAGTRLSRTTTSNDAGRYHFASVHAGTYDVTISKSGFKVFKASAQKVSVATQLTLDVVLEVGALTETVVVTSQVGTELQTANATVGNSVTAKELEALPNMGRDATTLLALQPGVTPTGFVAGAYYDQNSFTIDGGNNTDDMAGNTVGYINNFTSSTGGSGSMASGVVATPIESVEEFRVNTFGQTADFNSSSGAQVQMVTKRGTDQIHGTGYGYYYAPNLWGANTWVANHTPFNKGNVPASQPKCAPGTTYKSGDNNCIMPYTPIIPNHRLRAGFSASGPIIPKKFLGGKTYLFGNYEAFRYPNAVIFERSYPSLAMRAGVIQVPDASGVFQPYNLNPYPVTVQVGSSTSTAAPLRTVTLAPAINCPGVTVATPFCDPRGIGMNPIVNRLWGYGPAGGPAGTVTGQALLPLPNDPLAGDKYNYMGYIGTVRYPLISDNYVGRLDHDFSSKHHFFGSFRAFKLTNTPSNIQVDVGGALPGDSFGQYVSKAVRPQLGELMVLGLTSSLSSRITNDLRLSYLWNWWQWGTSGGPPQLPGLGGAVEIAPGNTNTAESTGAFIPYNVNTQQTRQRIWDGQDKMIRDDVSWVKGNHLFQFGGLFQKNYDFHNRSDNGSGVNNQITYQISAAGITWTSGTAPPWIPTTVPSAQRTYYSRLATEVLGMVNQTQVAYARAGSDLSLQPIGASAFDQSTIKSYNVYFTDTWKMKRTVTLNYGLGYTYETPPVEKNGKQVALVYQDGSLVDTADYLAKRKAAALQGQVYNPLIGFATTNSLKLRYPYNPFKKGFSPRVSMAWNPSFKSGLTGKLFGDGKTVLRGGYSLTWGRLNGVNLVLVPLLGVGLLQSVSCTAADMSGICASTSRNPTNIFRIGTDGLVAPLPAASATLPQPFFTGGLNPQAQDATMLDPAYKPEKVHNVDFTIQRQLGRRVSLEVGYMGRKISNVFQEINLDAVPYMTTLGGQTFADAYGKLYLSLVAGGTPATQPFIEAAFNPVTAFAAGGFCNGFTTCTAAVANKQGGNILGGSASAVWQALNNGTGWVLGRTMISAPLFGGPTNCPLTASCQGQATTLNMTTSLGFSNYNALFVTMRMREWHGVSGISNFTWGRSLGTGELAQYNSGNTALDPWNLRANYGPQNFDIKAIFNAGLSWQPNSFFGLLDFRNKKGVLGQVLKHWTIAPLFTYQSGSGNSVVTNFCNGGCAFGEVGNPNGNSGSTAENAVMGSLFTGGSSAHVGVVPTSGPGSNNQAGGINMFANPAAVLAEFRPCILGVDTSCGGYYTIRNPQIWNLDLALGKEFRFKERLGVKFSVQFTNVLNHFAPGSPSLDLSNSTAFGRITGQATTQRSTEFGLRISY